MNSMAPTIAILGGMLAMLSPLMRKPEPPDLRGVRDALQRAYRPVTKRDPATSRALRQLNRVD